MRLALMAMVVAGILLASASADEFVDPFQYPDGAIPDGWVWNGDPRGGGEFAVSLEAFFHTVEGHVHYLRDAGVCGAGVYDFDVFGSGWVFAWRITPGDPSAGRVLLLEHSPAVSFNYGFSEFDWVTPESHLYPDAQYWFTNGGGTHGGVSVPAEELVGWHHVTIIDGVSSIEIYIDGEFVLSHEIEIIPDGYVGLGSSGSVAAISLAFDNVSFGSGASPCEWLSWTRIKSLYR